MYIYKVVEQKEAFGNVQTERQTFRKTLLLQETFCCFSDGSLIMLLKCTFYSSRTYVFTVLHCQPALWEV